MDLYESLKTIHMIAGAGLFASLGFQAFVVRGLRRVGEVSVARRAFGRLGTGVRAGLVASAAILIPGVWMMAQRWGGAPWIVAALVGVAGMVVVAIRARPTMARLDAALREPSDRLPEALDAVASGRPVQALWLQSTIAIGIGILMFAKPGWLGSITILAVAIAVGLLKAFRAIKRSSGERPVGLRWLHADEAVPDRRPAA
ncbi:MAG: hypothetical protein ACRDG8_03365 [Actinomycetota bacterium]